MPPLTPPLTACRGVVVVGDRTPVGPDSGAAVNRVGSPH